MDINKSFYFNNGFKLDCCKYKLCHNATKKVLQ